jgi:serine protease AprX
MSRITINGISIDPTVPGPATAAMAKTDASQSDYILIQTTAPLTDPQRAQLEKLGVVIHEYVSENSYLCGYKPKSLAKVRALKFVAWAGVYMQDFKVALNLRPPAAAAAADVLQQAPAQATRRTLRNVDIVLHDDVDPNDGELKQKIAAAAHINPESLTMSRHKVRLNVQERYLNDVAAIDEVRHIEEVPDVKLFNNIARPILNANVVISGTPFQGDDELVVVNDTGFDKGSTTNVHPAFTGRVVKLVPLGRPGQSDDPDGHGTHVCGSVLGNGTSPSMGGAIQGTAPKAKLMVQSLLDSGGNLGGIPADLHDLFGPPYNNDGARIQTNSWGATTPGLAYSQSSQEIDDFVWNHQDCVICFAAGNDGIDSNGDGVIDPTSVGSEAAAKNCITVGASENNRPKIKLTYGQVRPTSWPHSPIFGDLTADNPEGMAAFSSRGPTKERRIKPDVVAPGTSILSTRSRNLVHPSTTFGTSSDPAYFFDDGTSMATPLVAGCCAVLRQTLVKNGLAKPSAALVKALLINGAVELTGQYSPTEAGPSPNNSSGWGRVNLAGSVILPGPDANSGFSEGGPLKQGQQSTVTINVPKASRSLAAVREKKKSARRKSAAAAGTQGVGPTLKVTLVWSDPAGATLQNDLDLIVTAASGQERHGNVGTSDGFDRLNNVEQVTWENVPPGAVKITVRAFRITKFPQPYAFAWRIG